MSNHSRIWAMTFVTLLVSVCVESCSPANEKAKDPLRARGTNEYREVPVGASTISVSGSNARLVNDLTILCKVWGFLKYYHPNVARIDVQWDSQLLRMLAESESWSNDSLRDLSLRSLIVSLGTFSERDNAEADSLIRMHPDTYWIDTSGLNVGLRQILHDIERARRAGCSPYAYNDPNSSKAVFDGELDYPLHYLRNARYRLLGLFRIWNVIQYFFPYRTIMDEPWDRALSYFIPKVAESDSVDLYILHQLELTAWLDDSHAYVSGYRSLEDFFGKHQLGLDIKFIDKRAYVVHVYDSDPNVRPARMGDEILAIGGKSIASLIQYWARYIPASNHAALYRDLEKQLVRTNASIEIVRLRRGARTITCRVPIRRAFQDYEDERVSMFFRPINGGRYGLIDMHYYSLFNLARHEKEMKRCEGLIIDLRTGFSGEGLGELGEFFLPWPTSVAKFSSPDCTLPGRFIQKGLRAWFGNRRNEHYHGKVVIMVNERTQSNLEYKAMIIAAAHQAHVIGSQTAGADGNVTQLTLPGGGLLIFTGLGVYYPNNVCTQRRGITVDINVQPSVESILAEKDVVLETALLLVNQ